MKQKVIENYFKAIGWEYRLERTGDIHGVDDIEYLGDYQMCDLPNIIDHWPLFKAHVLERMSAEGYTMDVVMMNNVKWMDDTTRDKGIRTFWRANIHNNELLLASVEAATKYWESKNAK